jgi:hypothetical protein
MQLEEWRLGVKGFSEPSREHTLQPVGSYRLSTLGGGAEVCRSIPSLDPLITRLCAGLVATRISAKPTGLSPTQNQSAWFFAATVGSDGGVVLGG